MPLVKIFDKINYVVIAGNNGFVPEYDDGSYDHSGADFQGRGRGRGRSFRGRGRGGYDGPQADVQQDGGYNEEAPPQRGRGMCFTNFFLTYAYHRHSSNHIQINSFEQCV